VAHRRIARLEAQGPQHADDAYAAPETVLRGHALDQRLQLTVDPGPFGLLSVVGKSCPENRVEWPYVKRGARASNC
jgi:hypothetical protein